MSTPYEEQLQAARKGGNSYDMFVNAAAEYSQKMDLPHEGDQPVTDDTPGEPQEATQGPSEDESGTDIPESAESPSESLESASPWKPAPEDVPAQPYPLKMSVKEAKSWIGIDVARATLALDRDTRPTVQAFAQAVIESA